MPNNYEMFDRFKSAIRNYDGDACSRGLLLDQDGPLSVYYCPFDWVNVRAKVVLVGITPGKVQAGNALAEAKRGLLAGAPTAEVLQRAKRTGAFSGSMRPNLIALLDNIGLPKWLGIESAGELFAGASGLLQTASVLQYPVYLNGENYNGTPDIAKTPFLRRMLIEHFGEVAKRLPDAVFVPLGPVPTKALTWLTAEGRLPKGKTLEGLPHPSGANGERIAYFLGTKLKAELSAKTDPVKLDAARTSLRAAVALL